MVLVSKLLIARENQVVKQTEAGWIALSANEG